MKPYGWITLQAENRIQRLQKPQASELSENRRQYVLSLGKRKQVRSEIPGSASVFCPLHSAFSLRFARPHPGLLPPEKESRIQRLPDRSGVDAVADQLPK